MNTAVVTETTCGICLEESKDPLYLPCGHSFCAGCLNEWRSRYGVEEEMRTKCPICRARIPPSKEMVATMLTYRRHKQELEDDNDTSSEEYHRICKYLKAAEEQVGADWDGVTILQDSRKPPVVMPDYIGYALTKGDINTFVRWINADRTEDRANATSSAENMGMSALILAMKFDHMTLATLLLQLGADVDFRVSNGFTAISLASIAGMHKEVSGVNNAVRLLLSWGASFFPDSGVSRENCIYAARKYGEHGLAKLIESELGGRRCEIINLSSLPELNGKTCVAE